MISWKYSLEKINGELELAKKKKQALDKLLDEGKVSQPTYDSFNNEVAEAISEIEAKQNSLVDKMKVKIGELEQQMKTLEHLLVNSEIRHISGEIAEESYDSECSVLSLGLETTKLELNEIKEAISNISGQDIGNPPPPPPSTQVEEEIAKVEPDTEKRLEIVMDTETTTSIETTVEEQPPVEAETEAPVESVLEQEEAAEPLAEEETSESFREEETQLSEEAETPETAEEVQVEEETAQEQD